MQNLIDIQSITQNVNIELVAKQIVEGFITGIHKSPFHGFSVEFAEHKIYNKGESIKHIDWKLFARTDKLFTKQYEEETNLRCHIVVDNSSSMLYPYNEKGKKNKLVFSLYAAAALINLMHKQRDAVGLTLISDKIEVHTPTKSSRSHLKRLFFELSKQLINVDKNKISNIAENLHYIADNSHKRSLIIMFSDMFDSDNSEIIFRALQHLKHKKHEVIIFHTIDKQNEINFNFNNRPYKFIDLETQEELKLNPNDIRHNYKQLVNKYFSDIKLKCSQLKIDLIEADINGDFNNILIPYLLKRKRLY